MAEWQNGRWAQRLLPRGRSSHFAPSYQSWPNLDQVSECILVSSNNEKCITWVNTVDLDCRVGIGEFLSELVGHHIQCCLRC